MEVKIRDSLELGEGEATAVVATQLEVGLGIGLAGEEGQVNICSWPTASFGRSAVELFLNSA